MLDQNLQKHSVRAIFNLIEIYRKNVYSTRPQHCQHADIDHPRGARAAHFREQVPGGPLGVNF